MLAVGTALLIFRTERGRRSITFVYQFNLPIPHIVGGVAMLLLLSQSGLFSRFAFGLGLTESPSDFPALTNDRMGFAHHRRVRLEGDGLHRRRRAGCAGRRRGRVRGPRADARAGRWKRFWHVIVPLITPAVVSTSVIVFAFSFGAFEIPFLLGQPFPVALPVLGYNYFRDVDLDSRPEAMAISVVIAGIVAVLVFAYTWIGRRYVRQDA